MWPFVFLPLGPQQFKDLHIWCELSDVSWVASLNLHEHVWAARLPPPPLRNMLSSIERFWEWIWTHLQHFCQVTKEPLFYFDSLSLSHQAVNYFKGQFHQTQFYSDHECCVQLWVNVTSLPCILRKVSRPRQSPELVWKYHQLQFICTKMPCGPCPAPEAERGSTSRLLQSRAVLCLLCDLTPQHIELCNSTSRNVMFQLHHRSGCGVNAEHYSWLCSIGTLKADLLTIKSDTKVRPTV